MFAFVGVITKEDVVAKTVLIVDDDDLNREVMEAFLSLNGYQSKVAGTGKSAIRLTETQVIDAIILDVRLPDLSGIEVCRHIRSNPKTEHIPILMITGLTDKNVREEAIAVGVTLFLPRPFDGDDFVEYIQRLFHESN